MSASDEAGAAARAAGLRYTLDDTPGIRRRRAGRGWSYIDSTGQPLADQEERDRIAALAIPPAWTDVWINPDPRGHIQATGRDARGRKQYRYHPQWRASRDDTKFCRLAAFGQALPGVRRRTEADLGQPGLPRQKTLAVVVRLLDASLIRVGNETYARENGSYGLTTLRNRHVAVTGTTLRFLFRGKSGKRHEVEITDRRAARIVRRLQDLPGQHLFQYLDEAGETHNIDSDDVNAYLHETAGEAFTARDFRTWAGTVLAARALRDLGPVEGATACQSNILAAVDSVAERLGNTRAVCRASYIHPAILEGYERGDLCQFSGSTRHADLDPDERWLLAYLRLVEESRSSRRDGKTARRRDGKTARRRDGKTARNES